MYVGLKLDVTSTVPDQGTAICHPDTSHTNSAYPRTGAARTTQRVRLLQAFEKVREPQPHFPFLPHQFPFHPLLAKVITVCHLGLTAGVRQGSQLKRPT